MGAQSCERQRELWEGRYRKGRKRLPPWKRLLTVSPLLRRMPSMPFLRLCQRDMATDRQTVECAHHEARLPQPHSPPNLCHTACSDHMPLCAYYITIDTKCTFACTHGVDSKLQCSGGRICGVSSNHDACVAPYCFLGGKSPIASAPHRWV
jgi:hypothetical protein